VQIICKYKDFYDYKCYEYGRDAFPTFDRRNCNNITQSQLAEWVLDLKHKQNNFERKQDELFYLEVGSTKFIFLANQFVRKDLTPHLTDNKTYQYDAIFKLIRIEFNLPKFWPPVMALSHANINSTLAYNIWKQYSIRRYNMNLENMTLSNECIDFGNSTETYLGKHANEIIENPILGKTKLVSLLNPFEIYKCLDSYLRSLHNDVDQESKGLTDIEKVENKGFNRIESFRNIHPRT
jgi:hypothetical protein